MRARQLAADGVARVATLRVDGRLAAFGYYLVVGDMAWLYRCASTPPWPRAARHPAAALLLRAGLGRGRAPGRVPGRRASYKSSATGSEPLLHGIGTPTTVAGQAAVASMRTAARPVALKRHEPFRRAYAEAQRLRDLAA